MPWWQRKRAKTWLVPEVSGEVLTHRVRTWGEMIRADNTYALMCAVKGSAS